MSYKCIEKLRIGDVFWLPDEVYSVSPRRIKAHVGDDFLRYFEPTDLASKRALEIPDGHEFWDVSDDEDEDITVELRVLETIHLTDDSYLEKGRTYPMRVSTALSLLISSYGHLLQSADDKIGIARDGQALVRLEAMRDLELADGVPWKQGEVYTITRSIKNEVTV